LKKQQEAKKYSEEKVAKFIETRVKELEKEKTITTENHAKIASLF
jgi:hypothetical protein